MLFVYTGACLFSSCLLYPRLVVLLFFALLDCTYLLVVLVLRLIMCGWGFCFLRGCSGSDFFFAAIYLATVGALLVSLGA